jgi:hypothetical protein
MQQKVEKAKAKRKSDASPRAEREVDRLISSTMPERTAAYVRVGQRNFLERSCSYNQDGVVKKRTKQA